MKIETYKDLRDFLNSMSDEQLSDKPYVSETDAEFALPISEAYVLAEDHYVDDEGSNPVSTFDPIDEDDKLEDHDIIPKGTIFLSADES